MKDYSTFSYGYLVGTGTYPHQNYSQLRVVSMRSLSSVYSVNGNFSTPNPHRYTAERERGLLGEIRVISSAWSSKLTGAMPYVYNWRSFIPSADSAAYNEALSEMYDKLRGSVDLSIDLIQWRKTLQMVNLYKRFIAGIAQNAIKLLPMLESVDDLTRSLKDSHKRTRRGKRIRRELNSALDAIAQARLEYIYGWSPTMKTLSEMAQGCLRTREMGLIKVEGKHTRVTETRGKDLSIDAAVPMYHDIRTSTRSRVVCFYNPRPGLIDNLQRISSLNPVSILYEATPFSFVLDWAINFSGFLRSFETAYLHKNDFVYGYMTNCTRTTVHSHMNGFHYNTGPLTTFALQGTAVRTEFNRSVLGAAPFPTKPVVAQNFGLSRILNGLALAKVVWPKADQHHQRGHRRYI